MVSMKGPEAGTEGPPGTVKPEGRLVPGSWAADACVSLLLTHLLQALVTAHPVHAPADPPCL